MSSSKITWIWVVIVVHVLGGFALGVTENDEVAEEAIEEAAIKDYEAARTTRQPIELWKVKKYGCGGSPRTARELKRMQTYGYPLELVCPVIDGAGKYVVQIKGVRGCAAIRSFESATNVFYLSELDIPPGRYQWAAAVYTEGGEWSGDVEVIEPVEIFRVGENVWPGENGKRVLLDLKHTGGHIRGWGYYNHAQYMIKELLERTGFEVGVNEKNLLTAEMLDDVELLVMNYYWTGWPGFEGYLESELSAIREFVETGGSLLVVGCDRSDGGGKMIEAGNELAKEFDLNFTMLDSTKGLARAEVADEQGIISFADPISIQLPVAVDGDVHRLLAVEGIPVAVAREYGNGRVVVAGVGMSFFDCYLGDCENREPLHLLLFYDFVRYLTNVDWTEYCARQYVDGVFYRCPSLRRGE